MDLLTIKPWWLWLSFIGLILTLILLDLKLLHRGNVKLSLGSHSLISCFYIFIGLAFGWWISYKFGSVAAHEYWTGFLVEKSLSIDNLFIISIIFQKLAIPSAYQSRVLFWGILGVLILRGIMIAIGATLVAKFSWILYIFSILLIITGFKLLLTSNQLKFADRLINWSRSLPSWCRVTSELHQEKFFIKLPNPNKAGSWQWWATPLFIALLLIELIDLIFAVDSIPAIFAITQDPYIVYTSNIFAILGLRSLYFTLAYLLDKFKYLHYSLGALLIFIGSKLFIADYMGWQKFPAKISLSITFGILLFGFLISWGMSWREQRNKHKGQQDGLVAAEAKIEGTAQ